jgi:hypothetical protein
MPALFIFLLKVNAALLLFCAGYYLVLRHLTFYTLNRVYLMGAIIFATVYPQINLDGFFQRHQQLAQPVYVVVDNLYLSQQALVQPAYWTWLEVIFFAGVVLLAAKLFMQLFSLYKVYCASRKAEIHGHEVRVVNGDGGPFSFWKSIYINPTGYNEADLRAILKHEQIHTDEWHTLDILLAELSVIFYWFNPGVWLMRKAVRENIEFITDRKILQQGADTKQYQYSLLNVSFSNTKPGIANHFNISTLKKRILMMNAKRSSKIHISRYLLLVPVLLVLLLAFSGSRAAIVKTSKATYKALALSVDSIVNDNPVSNAVAKIFTDSLKTPVAVKKNDTIKVIRTGKKDTLRLISSSNSFRTVIFLDSGKNDKDYHVLNFTVDTNLHKVTHVRINGKEYPPPAALMEKKIPDSILKRFFISRDTLGRIEKVVIPVDRSGGGARIVIDSASARIGALLKRMDRFTVNSDGSVSKVDGKSVMITNMPINGVSDPTKRMNMVTVRGFFYPKISIDSVNNKLMVIDGKEASARELKKLSVGSIQSLRVEKSPEIVKEYGEKAKEGVVFITTKKDK